MLDTQKWLGARHPNTQKTSTGQIKPGKTYITLLQPQKQFTSAKQGDTIQQEGVVKDQGALLFSLWKAGLTPALALIKFFA